jgi:CBS domain-containing protein
MSTLETGAMQMLEHIDEHSAMSELETSLRQAGCHRVAANTISFLKKHAPFNKMKSEALSFFAERAQMAFYPAGSEILGPDAGQVRSFYLIETGKVLARQAGEVTVTEYSVLSLGAGECFPIGAVTAGRPSTNVYTAVQDVFCYQLPAEDFLALLESSPEFNLFCTRYIASLLDQSRQQLQIQFAQRASEQQTLNSPLATIGSRSPVSVKPETTLRTALELMSRAGIGSLVIAGENKKPVGVFTRSDLLDRVVLADLPLVTPISQAMTASPLILDEHATAYDAMLAMASKGVRHVLVADIEGRLSGVVSERDLFALQRVGLRQVRQTIDSATDIETLQQATVDVRQLAFNMLAQGIGAEQLTQFISALNDALTRRVIQMNLENHNFDGVEWCWLAFGSEGRDEQTFVTDQDNGIVFQCADNAAVHGLKERFLAFALEVNRDLDRIGFPLCKGNIMAINPQWCLTLEEWNEQFSRWIRVPQPDALLNATIFFDFRPLFGQVALAEAMHRHLLVQTENNPMFLKAMAHNALDVEPPLGKIRDFLTDLEPGHPGKIDLKKYGSRIFVDVARIFALATGVHNANTVQRLRLASQRLSIRPDEVNAVLEGLHFIQILRLRHQYLSVEAGGEGDNLISPDELNELDRRILKESFRQARKLQTRLKLDYQVH